MIYKFVYYTAAESLQLSFSLANPLISLSALSSLIYVILTSSSNFFFSAVAISKSYLSYASLS